VIRKKTLPAQEELWIARDRIKMTKPSSFYDRLPADLDEQGFGESIRELCAPYYDAGAGGRPPIDPEVYFKMLIVGFFEKIGSERGIASRCEDSLSIRRFLRYDLTEATPDHSSLPVISNRQSEHGRELLRRRGEKVERSFRHLLDHGGARRTTLSGHMKIAKRMLVTAFGFNLSDLLPVCGPLRVRRYGSISSIG
jgi:transposase